MENFSKILFKRKEGISWIILNRPDKLNALDKESWMEISQALKTANENEDKVLVITGIGRAFSSGDDIQAMYNLKDLNESKEFFNYIYETAFNLINLNKVFIAAVNGLAYGGGCEILLLADIVVSVPEAKFAIPEGRLGLIPPIALAIGSFSLGTRRIARLIFTGKEIDVNEARMIGLVDYVVEKDKIEEKVLEIAKNVYLNDSYSILVMKRWLLKYRLKDLKKQ
jgi:Enoyl-CoA hydratase/carnithine racemase